MGYHSGLFFFVLLCYWAHVALSVSLSICDQLTSDICLGQLQLLVYLKLWLSWQLIGKNLVRNHKVRPLVIWHVTYVVFWAICTAMKFGPPYVTCTVSEVKLNFDISWPRFWTQTCILLVIVNVLYFLYHWKQILCSVSCVDIVNWNSFSYF